MLAERRRKTRYVLNPVKKPLWTTDSSGIKFGKELMEKMGWSAGKGLGANEQGIQEPLRVSSKNDTKGMGYKKSEENWIEYQDEFNTLLNQLASNAGNNAQINEAEKNEVMSLEEKSKFSKARMHYQKFTRGKDLSKYSENDLSCILGIGKLMKNKNETTIEIGTAFENNLCETSFGVTTINSGSIKDYFKKKWTANNLNFENSSAQQFLSSEQIYDEHISEKINTVLEKKSRKREKESRNESLCIENGDEENENLEIKKHKKRKKLNLEEEIVKKNKKNTCEIDIETQKGSENSVEIENSQIENGMENISNDHIINIPKFKEKKKKKRDFEQMKEVEFKYQSGVIIDEEINNKKKKKESEEKTRNSHEEEVIKNGMEVELLNETLKQDLKKTRKKEKRAENSLKIDNSYDVEVSEGVATEKLKNITETAPEKKTSKKKKLKLDAKFQDKDKNHFEQEWKHEKSQLDDDIGDELVKKRKKKKQKEEIKNSNENAIDEFKSETNIGKEKKKKQKEEFSEKEEIKNTNENAIDEFKSETNIGKEKRKKKKKESKENSEEQINEDFLEVELGNQGESKTGEKNSVKKKKKYLEELKNEEEVLVHKKFFIEEVAVAAGLSENNQKNNIYAETECQSDKVTKKIKKKNKHRVEHKADQLQENILESQEKMSKKKEDKAKSESHLDTSGVALEMKNTISNIKKENKSEKTDFIGETREAIIHTHKTALFHMKKPCLGSSKNYTTAKVLNLICGAEIERFKGSNLGSIAGYGYKKKIENNFET